MKRLILISSVALIGCASPTRIHYPDPHSEIYVDGELLGIGDAQLSKMGPSRTAKIKIKKNGELVTTKLIAREFTVSSFFIGIVTYYTGFYWAWFYPDEVNIPLVKRSTHVQQENGTFQPEPSIWADPSQSIWSQPIYKKD